MNAVEHFPAGENGAVHMTVSPEFTIPAFTTDARTVYLHWPDGDIGAIPTPPFALIKENT